VAVNLAAAGGTGTGAGGSGVGGGSPPSIRRSVKISSVGLMPPESVLFDAGDNVLFAEVG